jgi:hypothetical protein
VAAVTIHVFNVAGHNSRFRTRPNGIGGIIIIRNGNRAQLAACRTRATQ